MKKNEADVSSGLQRAQRRTIVWLKNWLVADDLNVCSLELYESIDLSYMLHKYNPPT